MSLIVSETCSNGHELTADAVISTSSDSTNLNPLDFDNNELIDNELAERGISLSSLDLPHSIKNRLYPHQKKGLCWLYLCHLKKSGGLLADDMGLGKTFQTTCLLTALMRMQQIHTVLIIAPVSVLESWKREISNFLLRNVNLSHVHLISSDITMKNRLNMLSSIKNSTSNNYHIVITSYSLIKTMIGAFNSTKQWDYVILDEASEIKNPSTEKSKAVHKLSSKYRLILTGTPVQNNLIEFHTLIDWVTAGRLLGNRSAFKQEYIIPILEGQDPKANKGKRQYSILQAQKLLNIVRPIFLQRKKIGLQTVDGTMKLSQKTEITVWIPLSSAQRGEYEKYLQGGEFKHAIEKAKSKSLCPVGAIGYLKSLCRHPLLVEASKIIAQSKRQSCNEVDDDDDDDELGSVDYDDNHNDDDDDDEVVDLCDDLHSPTHTAGRCADGYPLASPVATARKSSRRNKPTRSTTHLNDTSNRRRPTRSFKAAARNDSSLFDILDRRCDTRTMLTESLKLSVLLQLTRRLHRQGHRTLIFSQSKRMLDIIERVLDAKDLACDRIDGSVTGRQRQVIIDRFNARSRKTCNRSSSSASNGNSDGSDADNGSEGDVGASICLLTTRACGCGITLTGADRVIIYDPSWNPAEDRQAVDRAHRIGQTRAVVVYRLITASTVEEKMYEKQVFKEGVRLLAEKGVSSQHITYHDTTQLFNLGPADRCEIFDKLPSQSVLSRAPDQLAADAPLRHVLGYTRHDGLYNETSTYTDKTPAASNIEYTGPHTRSVSPKQGRDPLSDVDSSAGWEDEDSLSWVELCAPASLPNRLHDTRHVIVIDSDSDKDEGEEQQQQVECDDDDSSVQFVEKIIKVTQPICIDSEEDDDHVDITMTCQKTQRRHILLSDDENEDQDITALAALKQRLSSSTSFSNDLVDLELNIHAQVDEGESMCGASITSAAAVPAHVNTLEAIADNRPSPFSRIIASSADMESHVQSTFDSSSLSPPSSCLELQSASKLEGVTIGTDYATNRLVSPLGDQSFTSDHPSPCRQVCSHPVPLKQTPVHDIKRSPSSASPLMAQLAQSVASAASNGRVQEYADATDADIPEFSSAVSAEQEPASTADDIVGEESSPKDSNVSNHHIVDAFEELAFHQRSSSPSLLSPSSRDIVIDKTTPATAARLSELYWSPLTSALPCTRMTPQSTISPASASVEGTDNSNGDELESQVQSTKEIFDKSTSPSSCLELLSAIKLGRVTIGTDYAPNRLVSPLGDQSFTSDHPSPCRQERSHPVPLKQTPVHDIKRSRLYWSPSSASPLMAQLAQSVASAASNDRAQEYADATDADIPEFSSAVSAEQEPASTADDIVGEESSPKDSNVSNHHIVDAFEEVAFHQRSLSPSLLSPSSRDIVIDKTTPATAARLSELYWSPLTSAPPCTRMTPQSTISPASASVEGTDNSNGDELESQVQSTKEIFDKSTSPSSCLELLSASKLGRVTIGTDYATNRLVSPLGDQSFTSDHPSPCRQARSHPVPLKQTPVHDIKRSRLYWSPSSASPLMAQLAQSVAFAASNDCAQEYADAIDDDIHEPASTADDIVGEESPSKGSNVSNHHIVNAFEELAFHQRLSSPSPSLLSPSSRDIVIDKTTPGSVARLSKLYWCPLTNDNELGRDVNHLLVEVEPAHAVHDDGHVADDEDDDESNDDDDFTLRFSPVTSSAGLARKPILLEAFGRRRGPFANRLSAAAAVDDGATGVKALNLSSKPNASASAQFRRASRDSCGSCAHPRGDKENTTPTACNSAPAGMDSNNRSSSDKKCISTTASTSRATSAHEQRSVTGLTASSRSRLSGSSELSAGRAIMKHFMPFSEQQEAYISPMWVRHSAFDTQQPTSKDLTHHASKYDSNNNSSCNVEEEKEEVGGSLLVAAASTIATDVVTTSHSRLTADNSQCKRVQLATTPSRHKFNPRPLCAHTPTAPQSAALTRTPAQFAYSTQRRRSSKSFLALQDSDSSSSAHDTVSDNSKWKGDGSVGNCSRF